MKIAISAESSIDLDRSTLKRYDIRTVPFSILLGNESGYDGEITTEQIIDYVATSKNLPKTGAVNVYAFEEHFKSLLNDYDAVIHFSLSGEVSSAYQNAETAAKSFKNVFVLNTRTISSGIGLLAVYARELANDGAIPEEILKKCESRIENILATTIIARLDYLYKGGRCNALQLFGANLLKLRVQITVKNGKLTPAKKYRGDMDSCVEKFVADVLETYNSPDLTRAFITATTPTEKQIEIAKNLLLKRGFKEVIVTKAGATVTSHVGENAIGVIYFNDGEPSSPAQQKQKSLLEKIKARL